MAKRLKGLFITFEGSEGCGKSTQVKLLCDFLKREKRDVLHIREPGGIKISEKIRTILLDDKNKEMARPCEVLLYMAARAQLVHEKILPALRKGSIVVCDRFLDSTIAYQGYGCGEDIRFIRSIGSYVTQDILPDITFLLDLPTHKGLSRIQKPRDRIEQRSLQYHNRVRQGYLKIARQEPKRIKVIAGHQSREAIRRIIENDIRKLLP
ncbi:MAG TPA: dTMP kinase [Candidatus Omnitrophota bacterium]|nr:dTMP kinase [Candidatus Omnitrophota bacterium]HQL40914.1 dTMP kinase [Candidatus Omnitrophota bacterium]